MIRIATILFATLLPVAASAQAFLQDYLHPKDATDRIETYLEGLRDGVASYNAMTKEKRFCLPEGVVLTDELAHAAISGWVKKQTPGPAVDNMPTVVALVTGLEETFPCKK
jgi:hypothetical protein